MGVIIRIWALVMPLVIIILDRSECVQMNHCNLTLLHKYFFILEYGN